MNEAKLEKVHQTKSASSPLTQERNRPLQYGDPRLEHQAVCNSFGLIDISPWSTIQVTGPDRKSFLHGMVSNEVKGLKKGEGNQTLILTNKGKIIAKMWLFDRGDDLLILARENLNEPIVSTLEKYHIMEDLEIKDVSGQSVLISVQGRHVEEHLAPLLRNNTLPREEFSYNSTSIRGKECEIVRLSHTGETGFILLVSSQDSVAIWEELVERGGKPIGDLALESLRLESGIPVCGKELDETVIPQEALLHHAISYEKGCYIGQETVARLHFRGKVNRELTSFTMKTESLPQTPFELESDGKKVGKITSVCHSYQFDHPIGLGFLRCELRNEGQELMVKDNEEKFVVKVGPHPLVNPIKVHPLQ